MDDERLLVTSRYALVEDLPLYPQITLVVRRLLISAEEEHLDVDLDTLVIREVPMAERGPIGPIIEARAETTRGELWEGPEERERRMAYEAGRREKFAAIAERNRQTRPFVQELAEEIEKASCHLCSGSGVYEDFDGTVRPCGGCGYRNN